MSESVKLPPGWELTNLQKVVAPVLSIDPRDYPDQLLTYFDIGSIDGTRGIVTNPKRIFGKDAPSRARQVVQPGDVLVSTVRPYLRAIAQVPEGTEYGVASTAFCVLRGETGISNAYLYYLTRSDAFIKGLEPLQRGTSYPAVRDCDVLAQAVPLAPSAEQIRIVEKLEKLFADLDAAVVDLQAAHAKLKQYRQSLLKAAVTGELTAEWRKQHLHTQKQVGRIATPIETGEELLARILIERRRRWEVKQLAKFKDQGKLPPKNWQSKYPEPVLPDVVGLPVLPNGWTWVTVAQVGDVQIGRQRSPDKVYGLSPAKYIRAANITEQGIDFGDVLEMDFTPEERETFQLHVGDIVLTEASGSPEHVGRPALWPERDGLYCFQNTVIRFSPLIISSQFSFLVFQAWHKLGKFVGLAGGIGINHLSGGKLSAITIPLPSLAEQVAIEEQLRQGMQQLDQQAEAIAESLQQAAIQRKNILKEAFSGEFVLQEPIDEPVSMLMDQIRIESASRAKVPKMRTTKTLQRAKRTNSATSIEVVMAAIQAMPGDEFTFNELNRLVPIGYEMTKEAVFALLTEQPPRIKQVFDLHAQAMRFIRVKP